MIVLTAEQHKRILAIREVLRQQRDHFDRKEVKHYRTRLRQCVEYQESLTGEKVTRIGMDTIYASNENRKYCTQQCIMTNFVRKGPKPKDEPADVSTARRIIGNLRATVMEGSFGNRKQHFGVGRIAARNRYSETLLLFFGIHMANAATLVAR